MSSYQPPLPKPRRQSYIRHAAREFSIMKRLSHDAIVRLYDCFEIDGESFATVLELCESTDLDAHLKVRRIGSKCKICFQT